MKLPRILTSMLAVSLLFPIIARAENGTPPTPAQRAEWRKNHPARTKDNARIRNQRKQLKADLASGKITQAQYNTQMQQLNTIKKEERVDARANQNGGHLTGGQQQAINQQLNQSRQTINQDAGTPPPAPPTPPASAGQ
jgi:hypothetical protein